VYGARAEKPIQNAHFAMKQTNICRLSGDIKRQTRPHSSAGSRPPLHKFSGYVEVDAHYIFHPSTIWVRPLFTELGPKNPPKDDFAMKQTNICRLSGDIITGF